MTMSPTEWKNKIHVPNHQSVDYIYIYMRQCYFFKRCNWNFQPAPKFVSEKKNIGQWQPTAVGMSSAHTTIGKFHGGFLGILLPWPRRSRELQFPLETYGEKHLGMGIDYIFRFYVIYIHRIICVYIYIMYIYNYVYIYILLVHVLCLTLPNSFRKPNHAEVNSVSELATCRCGSHRATLERHGCPTLDPWFISSMYILYI